MTDINLDHCHHQYAVIDLTTRKAIHSYERFDYAKACAKRNKPSLIIDLHTSRICDVFTPGTHLSVGIMGIRTEPI